MFTASEWCSCKDLCSHEEHDTIGMFFSIVSNSFSAELARYLPFIKVVCMLYLTALSVGVHRRLNLCKMFGTSVMLLHLLCSSEADLEIFLPLSISNSLQSLGFCVYISILC